MINKATRNRASPSNLLTYPINKAMIRSNREKSLYLIQSKRWGALRAQKAKPTLDSIWKILRVRRDKNSLHSLSTQPWPSLSLGPRPSMPSQFSTSASARGPTLLQISLNKAASTSNFKKSKKKKAKLQIHSVCHKMTKRISPAIKKSWELSTSKVNRVMGTIKRSKDPSSSKGEGYWRSQDQKDVSHKMSELARSLPRLNLRIWNLTSKSPKNCLLQTLERWNLSQMLLTSRLIKSNSKIQWWDPT